MNERIGVVVLAISIGFAAWVIGTILADVLMGRFMKFILWCKKLKSKGKKESITHS